MVIPWEPLRDVLMSNRRFILSSHVRPDADAIGSELGLAAILQTLGKEVRIVNPSAIPATLSFLDPDHKILKIGEDIKPEALLETDVHIVVDTSSWSQLQDVGTMISPRHGPQGGDRPSRQQRRPGRRSNSRTRRPRRRAC